jgi:hypothetical protein
MLALPYGRAIGCTWCLPLSLTRSLDFKSSVFVNSIWADSWMLKANRHLHQKLSADGIVVLHHVHYFCKKWCTTYHFYLA